MGKRRGHNEGSISQYPDGRWVARITLDGGRRRAHYAKTRQEAARWLSAALRDRDQGLPSISDRQTLAQFVTTWLETVKPTVRLTTWKRYEELARLHIVPTLGKTSLAKIAPQQLQQLYARKLTEGLSPTTVHAVHVALHRILKDALRMGAVARNVCDLVTSPRKAAHQVTALTPEQARTFLDAAHDDWLYALYVLAMSSGMRESELLGLHWRDVDLSAGMLQVRTGLHRVRGQFHFTDPKSARSRRQVTLTARTIAALKDHRRRQNAARLGLGDAWQDLDLVFPLQDGSPMAGTHLLQSQFRPMLAHAKLPTSTRFHDLRHTAATMLLGEGIHPSIVASMLGHSTIAVTLDVYSHVTPTIQRGATEAMERLLGS